MKLATSKTTFSLCVGLIVACSALAADEFGQAASRGQSLTIAIEEPFGIDHTDQIIDFDLPERIEAEDVVVRDENGREVVYQLLDSGKKIAIRTDLPAGAQRQWSVTQGIPQAKDPHAVTVKETGNVYEIATDRIGIRLPTSSFALPSNTTPLVDLLRHEPRDGTREFLPAPVQGFRLRNGSWTASRPSVLTALAHPGSGRFSVRFLERGPLKVVVEIRYDLHTPEIKQNGLLLKAAGPGFHVTSITVQAGQPSILFEEWSNLEACYAFDFNSALQPTHARYRGHHSTSTETGYEPDGKKYRPNHERRTLDAEVSVDYSRILRAGHQSGPNSRRWLGTWDPWVYDSGWYWQFFDKHADAASPLIGLFTGRASRLKGVGFSGVGLTTKPAIDKVAPVSAITVDTYRRHGNRVRPATRFQWGLFVGTKSDLADATEVQPINRQMNLHGGINLNKLHRLQFDFADPPDGYGGMFMGRSEVQSRIAKLRNDEDYFQELYRDGQARPLLHMWKDSSGRRRDEAAQKIVERSKKLLTKYVNGNGIFDTRSHYWMGTGDMVRDMIWIDQILADPNTPPQTQRQLKAIAVVYAAIIWDDDFVPFQEGAGVGHGNENMVVTYNGHRSFFALALAQHPMMKERIKNVAEKARINVHRTINEHGSPAACPQYNHAMLTPLLNTLLQLKQRRIADLFEEEPRLRKLGQFLLHQMTPPEPRASDHRCILPLGDGGLEPTTLPGVLATGFRDVDRSLAEQLVGMWRASGTRHSSSYGATCLTIDDSLSSRPSNLRDASFPGYLSVLRNDYGTENETAAWLVSGDFHRDHRAEDHNSLILYALGKPIANDWCAFYSPQTRSSFFKNAVVFANSIPGGWSSDSPPISGSSVGTRWRGGSEQAALESFPEGSYTRAWCRTGHDNDQTQWTREVIKIHGDPTHPILVVRDRFTGAGARDPKVITWQLEATGAIESPAGLIMPALRKHPRAHHDPHNASHERPSASKPFDIPAGPARFGFSGSFDVDFDVYLPGTDERTAVVGNWSAFFYNPFARETFQHQHILRVHGSSDFTTVILPWRRANKPKNLRVIQTDSETEIRCDAWQATIFDAGYTWTRNARKASRRFPR